MECSLHRVLHDTVILLLLRSHSVILLNPVFQRLFSFSFLFVIWMRLTHVYYSMDQWFWFESCIESCIESSIKFLSFHNSIRFYIKHIPICTKCMSFLLNRPSYGNLIIHFKIFTPRKQNVIGKNVTTALSSMFNLYQIFLLPRSCNYQEISQKQIYT